MGTIRGGARGPGLKRAGPRRVALDQVLPSSPKDPQPPWAGEIDTRLFYVDLPGNAGPVAEAAFLHKASKTLLATDAVAWIPRGTAPDIFRTVFPDSLVDQSRPAQVNSLLKREYTRIGAAGALQAEPSEVRFAVSEDGGTLIQTKGCLV